MFYQELSLHMYNSVLEELSWIQLASDAVMKKNRSIMLCSNVLILLRYGDVQKILWLVNFQIILKKIYLYFSS
ncbi:unnamed protein product [Brassica oleracea]|uniref:Uncharacterized protein n=1 Tax=Brassica oleracea TaxID=3712 RepID=A0A3P6C0J2_BRAOL|nr:unnamed protein product [Brassica oleracea]